MKKRTIKKTALFIIISIILNSFLLIAFAENGAEADLKESDTPKSAVEAKKAFNEPNFKTSCIHPDEEKEYLITIIEEPLDTSDNSNEDHSIGPDYKTEICYRVYYSYMAKRGSSYEQKVFTAISKKCPTTIKPTSQEMESVKDKGRGVIFTCNPVQVIFSRAGTTLIQGYIGTIYRWAAGLVGILSVTVIIISGIQISVAGGDTQAIDDAKGRIVKSLAGLAVLFLSGLILYTINPTFFTR